MARIVVLSFQNNKEAEAFALEMRASGPAEVVGLYMRPTVYCECPPSGKSRVSWSKGKKFGLWIHTCGKPSRLAWHNMLYKLSGFGYDLMPKEKDDGIRQDDEGAIQV